MSSSTSHSSAAVTAAAPKRVRKYWTPKEDKKLIECVGKYGPKKWNEIARKSGLSRTGRSCRMRWIHQIQPGINKEKFTKDEDETIRKLLKVHGKKAWSKIARKLQRRNGNQVKNYWNSLPSKKIPVPNEEELIGISQYDDDLETSKKIPVSNEEELIEISGDFIQFEDVFEEYLRSLETRGDGNAHPLEKIPVPNEEELIEISDNFIQFEDVFEEYLRSIENDNVRGDGNAHPSEKIPVPNEEELIGISQYDDDLESSKKIPVSNEEELIEISGNFIQFEDVFEEYL